MNRNSPSKPMRGAIPGKHNFNNLNQTCEFTAIITSYCIFTAHLLGDSEDPYPSLSDFHDYEPNLEFDDTELQQPVPPGGVILYLSFSANLYLNFIIFTIR